MTTEAYACAERRQSSQWEFSTIGEGGGNSGAPFSGDLCFPYHGSQVSRELTVSDGVEVSPRVLTLADQSVLLSLATSFLRNTDPKP